VKNFIFGGKMKNLLLLLFLNLFVSPAFASHYTMAKITQVSLLESDPIQYLLFYQRTCDDLGAQPVMVKDENTVVLGVLVLRGSNTRPCNDLSEPGQVKIKGEFGDDGSHFETINP